MNIINIVKLGIDGVLSLFKKQLSKDPIPSKPETIDSLFKKQLSKDPLPTKLETIDMSSSTYCRNPIEQDIYNHTFNQHVWNHLPTDFNSPEKSVSYINRVHSGARLNAELAVNRYRKEQEEIRQDERNRLIRQAYDLDSVRQQYAQQAQQQSMPGLMGIGGAVGGLGSTGSAAPNPMQQYGNSYGNTNSYNLYSNPQPSISVENEVQPIYDNNGQVIAHARGQRRVSVNAREELGRLVGEQSRAEFSAHMLDQLQAIAARREPGLVTIDATITKDGVQTINSKPIDKPPTLVMGRRLDLDI